MDAVDSLLLTLVAIITHLAAYTLGRRSVPSAIHVTPHIDVHAHVWLAQPSEEVDDGEGWKLGDPMDN